MNSVVLGLGFGDEGKGRVVDYLCSIKQRSSTKLVIRFSGGHQAGHTVSKNGTKHIFSSFGSGTFQGVPTYWSEYCTVNPMALETESNVLEERKVSKTLFIDQNCPITTPYDIVKNIMSADMKLKGSCGVGFGSTIQREEDFYSLKALDLEYPLIFKEKLRLIKSYYEGYPEVLQTAEGFMPLFLKSCEFLNRYTHKTQGIPTGFNDYIFEGSQGLLLDQHFGFFPNVTRSNTSMKNVINLLGEDLYNVYLVTRAYQTRHGNGFMTNEENKLLNTSYIKDDPTETNVTNFQGEFRKSILDISLLEYGLKKDPLLKNRKKTLCVTCLDHLTAFCYTHNDRLYKTYNLSTFLKELATILNVDKVLYSQSAEGPLSTFTDF